MALRALWCRTEPRSDLYSESARDRRRRNRRLRIPFRRVVFGPESRARGRLALFDDGGTPIAISRAEHIAIEDRCPRRPTVFGEVREPADIHITSKTDSNRLSGLGGAASRTGQVRQPGHRNRQVGGSVGPNRQTPGGIRGGTGLISPLWSLLGRRTGRRRERFARKGLDDSYYHGQPVRCLEDPFPGTSARSG